ncbi:MAG TPA: hypothetical protein VGR78_00965 [Verrucomicrobiae bacterium]|nr:hypothetical protein [Verrucomicrobiae bacterium]
MKTNWNFARWAGLLSILTVAMLGASCGGISAGGSASPATFLLPGIGQNTPKQSSPTVAPGKASPTVAAYSAELPQ